jgi:hypothetical protein
LDLLVLDGAAEPARSRLTLQRLAIRFIVMAASLRIAIAAASLSESTLWGARRG